MMKVFGASRSVARTVKAQLQGGSANKVFAIGFNKTGSSSIHALFNELGYHSYHGERWRKTSRPYFHWCYDSFCDGVPDRFETLDERFPGSRFIMQVRDLDTWLNSRLEHIRRTPAHVLAKSSADWSLEPSSVKSWIEQRNRYHLAVLDYFQHRPQDFMVVNFIRNADSAGEISRFLGGSNEVRKPHLNKNRKASSELRNTELIAAVCSELGIPESERANDTYCPCLLSDPELCQHLPDTDHQSADAGVPVSEPEQTGRHRELA